MTFNKRHFPPVSTSPWNVKAVGPAAFLEELFLAAPEIVSDRMEQQARDLRSSLPEQLTVLAKAVPSFVEIARGHL